MRDEFVAREDKKSPLPGFLNSALGNYIVINSTTVNPFGLTVTIQ